MEKKLINNKVPGWLAYLSSIVRYRSLMMTLVRRDLKVRYSQTALGMVWSLFQPLMALVIFTVFFQGMIHLDTEEIAYPVYAFSGMILWYFFTGIVGQASNALIHNEDLIKKIYFPRLLLLLAKTLVSSVDFAIAFVFFIVICFVFGELPKVSILLIPLIALMLIFVALTVALWVSTLSVRRRDVLHAIPTLLNFAIWVTPVFYPASIIPEAYQDVFHLVNPVATVIELFRWSALGTPMVWIHCFCFIWVFILFLIGMHLFRKAEGNIADYV